MKLKNVDSARLEVANSNFHFTRVSLTYVIEIIHEATDSIFPHIKKREKKEEKQIHFRIFYGYFRLVKMDKTNFI